MPITVKAAEETTFHSNQLVSVLNPRPYYLTYYNLQRRRVKCPKKWKADQLEPLLLPTSSNKHPKFFPSLILFNAPSSSISSDPRSLGITARISEHIVNDFTTRVSGGLIATDFYLFSELQSLRFQRACRGNWADDPGRFFSPPFSLPVIINCLPVTQTFSFSRSRFRVQIDHLWQLCIKKK